MTLQVGIGSTGHYFKDMIMNNGWPGGLNGTGSHVLKIRTGSVPATPATADSGTVLASITLPSTWLATSTGASGYIDKTGTWSDTSADADGTAGHFRIYYQGGSEVMMQGTVSATAGSGDLRLTTTSITAGMEIIITQFVIQFPPTNT